jgi:hypothetical protein
MPGEESVDYILEPPNEAVSRGSSSSEKQLIFCIDISGSMYVLLHPPPTADLFHSVCV